ncbi:MAG TPA: TIGR04282 family arsenosugar biosynthesis glycosyltransferase [Candidatus Polarisedimenticolia bacterium]
MEGAEKVLNHTGALVIYARPPVLGKVKTRLQPALTHAEGLALYEAMLADVIERAAGGRTDRATTFLAWSEACEPPASLKEVLGLVSVERQVGGDLGERMAHTLQEKLRGGFGRVILVGADSPNLPLDYLRQAFEALREVDLVYGPADDGGYYLVGARRLHPRIFQTMPWGTDRVLAITRQRIKDGRISHRELPRWYDVDTPADLVRLWKDLQHMKAKGAAEVPRRTLRMLASLVPGRL